MNLLRVCDPSAWAQTSRLHSNVTDERLEAFDARGRPVHQEIQLVVRRHREPEHPGLIRVRREREREREHACNGGFDWLGNKGGGSFVLSFGCM